MQFITEKLSTFAITDNAYTASQCPAVQASFFLIFHFLEFAQTTFLSPPPLNL